MVCMPIDPKSPKVVVEHGSQSVAIGSGNKSQVTIVGCVSAAGFCMPPMVIWDRKTLAPELTVGEVPGQSMGFPVMGGWTQELFEIWFSSDMLPLLGHCYCCLSDIHHNTTQTPSGQQLRRRLSFLCYLLTQHISSNLLIRGALVH